jgi:DNA-binding CsgD family transcriptional regulator
MADCGMEGVMDDQLIDRIYEAAVLPDHWPAVLELMGRRFGTKGGLLFSNSTEGTRWLGGGPVAQAMQEFLESGWMPHNERPARIISRGHPGFLTDLDLSTKEEIASSAMFQEFLIPRGFAWASATFVPGLGDDMLILSVEGFTSHAASRRAVPELDELRPHLARAAQLASQFRLERVKAYVAALDAIGAAAGVLSSNGNLLAANPRFQSELGHTVLDMRSRLHLSDTRADAMLADALSRIRAGEPHGRSIVLRTMKQGARVLHILPIRREANDLFVNSTALAILTNPLRTPQVNADLLRSLFDLTPAEAKLASCLVTGDRTLKQVAREFNVSASTVKTQLRAIFDKTGTTRQAELTQLLSSVDVM